MLVVWVSGCMHTSRVMEPNKLINHIGSSTAALVLTKDDGVMVYCTGVWISKNEILTAHHCAQAVVDIAHEDDSDYEEGSISTIGTEIHFSLWQENRGVDKDPSAVHLGIVTMIDKEHDLALVQAYKDVPEHEISTLASERPALGSKIHVVGHVAGLYWSFVEGVVSNYRDTLDKVDFVHGPFMQMSAPVWYGNSGGGVFNENGELCGIISFKLPVPMTSFAIDIKSINKMLIKYHWKK